MSGKIMGKVWDLDLPHNKLLVLLALADHADHEGNNVFPSLGLVAWKTGYSQQQCRRVMSELEKDGILVATQRRQGFKTIYRIDTNKGVQKELYTPSKMSPLPKSNPLHFDTPDPLHFDHSTPDMTSRKKEHEPSSEPSLEPSGERKRSTPRSKSKSEPTELHPIIAAWAKVRGIDAINIGAPVYSTKDLTLARKMAKWAIPPTDDEISTAVNNSKEKATYPFSWLESDIPKLRLTKQPTKPLSEMTEKERWASIPELRGITEIIR